MKILALSFGHSLAHVTRPLEIAKVLRARGHEVLFAGCGQYMAVARDAGFQVMELPFVPEDRIKQVMRSGKWGDLYIEKELESWISAEVDLFKRVRPDVLLVDTWVTASSSAELAGIPRIVIMNAHMSTIRAIPFSQRTGRSEGLLWRLYSRFMSMIELQFYHRFMIRKVNRVRKRLGLQPRYSHSIEHGDLTLLADVPEFNPTRALPDSFHYVGPLTWKSGLPAPACLSKLEPGRPVVYVTIGSLGKAEKIRELANAAPASWYLVFATGDSRMGRDEKFPPNVFVESFVNADLLLPRCDAILCHGGNGTLYQALTHGVPVVGAAVHEEQYFGLKVAQTLGLGIGFDPKASSSLGTEGYFEALRKVIENPAYRQKALEFGKRLRDWDAPKTSADLIERFMAHHLERGFSRGAQS